jgi:hypothetical protein
LIMMLCARNVFPLMLNETSASSSDLRSCSIFCE